MNVQTNPGAQPFALMILLAVFSAVFWMVVGWRAMRAHERLADAAEELARKKEREGV